MHFPGWVCGWVGGWVDECKSLFKDFIQPSKITFARFLTFTIEIVVIPRCGNRNESKQIIEHDLP